MYKRDDECPGKETFSYKCTQQFYLRMYISTYIIAYHAVDQIDRAYCIYSAVEKNRSSKQNLNWIGNSFF